MFMENESQYSLNVKFDFVIAPYNDIAAVDAALSALPPNSLAAILVEPVQVSGGCIPGNRAFLQHLRQVAITHKAVLIFDEVMTSRLSYGGLQVELGIRPDLTTVGKWLGGGMSFGAFGGVRDIMDMFDPRTGRLSHSGTFNNNVVTMAAGVAGCQLMTKAKIEDLNSLGDRLRGRIAETIKARIDIVDGQSAKIFVIGAGSLFAIRFQGPDHKILSTLLYHHLLENGIYIAARGFLALTIEITEERFRPLLGALESFIDKYHTSLA
jgi:glutamate-1-semialdehyde 2,1-aminomutase